MLENQAEKVGEQKKVHRLSKLRPKLFSNFVHFSCCFFPEEAPGRALGWPGQELRPASRGGPPRHGPYTDSRRTGATQEKGLFFILP
jgi:hypothetical protein